MSCSMVCKYCGAPWRRFEARRGRQSQRTQRAQRGARVGTRAGLDGRRRGTADCADWGGLGVGCRRQDCQRERPQRARRGARRGTKEDGGHNHKEHNGHKGGRGCGPRGTGWTAKGESRSARRGARRGTKEDGGQSQRTQRAQRGRGWEPAQDWMDGEGKPRIARIVADWGSATADRTARGKDHRGHEGGHGGARRRMGIITKNTMGTKGARAWPAQDCQGGFTWAAREARAVGSGQRAKPAERPAEPASLPRHLARLS